MIRVRQIEVDIDNNKKEEILNKTANKLKIRKEEIIELKINKKSIDARKKPYIKIIYEVDIKVENERKILQKTNNDILKTPDESFKFEITGPNELKNRPVIVGAGPAGLFATYFLALKGYKPILIERGEKVEDRIKSVENYWNNNELNTNSNVQFGEGGAGTFSDGKLNTLSKDKEFLSKKVFEIFVENGANEDILYEHKPHIGTDVLRKVIINMRNKILELGADIRFNTCLTNINIESNQIKSIIVNNNEEIITDNLILAIGHSARDTFEMLNNKNIDMIAKPFAVGVRIQHPQKMINKSQYGIENHKELKAASYKLTYQASNNRGVYSFCMCPGGYVVNASSEEGLIAINGMSDYNRDSENANSAIVVTVTPKDYGEKPLDGLEFQRNLEKLAYIKGNKKIPVQLYKDFKNNQISTNFKTINPVFKGETNFADLNEILPDYICDSLKEGIEYFGTKIKGYNHDDAILAGVESRTSSPIRINRDDSFTSNIKGIYPIGEGAGYAGGITTSAMDGIKLAKVFASIYKP